MAKTLVPVSLRQLTEQLPLDTIIFISRKHLAEIIADNLTIPDSSLEKKPTKVQIVEDTSIGGVEVEELS